MLYNDLIATEKVPSNASFESTEKGFSAFIEGLDQKEKYMVQFRTCSNYKETYIPGQEGLCKLVPTREIYMDRIRPLSFAFSL